MNRPLLLAVLMLVLWTLGAGKDDAFVEGYAAWKKYPPNVTWIPAADSTDRPQIKIEGADHPTTTTVAIFQPPLQIPDYQIHGDVWYTDVRGTAYLEMLSYFPDGHTHFTKSLDSSGPLQSISGSSNWQTFVLPFHARRGMLPTKVELNVVLSGKGIVKLSPLILSPIAPSFAWWSPQTGGWIGGILGSLLGCMGGLIGWLSSRGRAPRLVIALMYSMIVVAVALLIGGVFALAARQSREVYYPLLLCGGIVLVVMISRLPPIKRRYAEVELRRMTAMDLPA
jgi:hypothetical protein